MCSDGDSFGESKVSGKKIEQRKFHAAGTGQGGVHDADEAEISAVVNKLQAATFKGAAAEVTAVDSISDTKGKIDTHSEEEKPNKHDVSPYSDTSASDEGRDRRLYRPQFREVRPRDSRVGKGGDGVHHFI